jgi:hypothetical protein
MAAHYCINCPRCRSGCSICRRCACTPEQLDAWLNETLKPFSPVSPLLATPLMSVPHEYLNVTPSVPTENTEQVEDREQLPETD